VSSLFRRTAYGWYAELARKPDDNFRDARQNVDVLMSIEVRRPDAGANDLPDLRSEFDLNLRQAHLP
jgi:hypothetical protein